MSRHGGSYEKKDHFQAFFDQLIAELERGVRPWVKPWNPDKCGGPKSPFNPTTGDRYKEIIS